MEDPRQNEAAPMAAVGDGIARFLVHPGIHPKDVTTSLGCLGLSWPPPERLVVRWESGGQLSAREPHEGDSEGRIMTRVGMSQLSDEAAAQYPHLARWVEYAFPRNRDGR